MAQLNVTAQPASLTNMGNPGFPPAVSIPTGIPMTKPETNPQIPTQPVSSNPSPPMASNPQIPTTAPVPNQPSIPMASNPQISTTGQVPNQPSIPVASNPQIPTQPMSSPGLPSTTQVPNQLSIPMASNPQVPTTAQVPYQPASTVVVPTGQPLSTTATAEERDPERYCYTKQTGANISAISPSKKSYITEHGMELSYSNIPLYYNYASPGHQPDVEPWTMEYSCGVWSNGINKNEKTTYKKDSGNVKKDSYVTYSTTVTFDRHNPEQVQLIDKLDNDIYFGVARAISPYKPEYQNQLYSNDKSTLGLLLKPIVYYKRDETTKQIIPGLNPTQIIQLQGHPDSPSRTYFVGINGRPYTWQELMNKRFRWIPLILYSHVYNGNQRMSIQNRAPSGIIIEIKDMGNADKQKASLPVVQARFADKLAQLNEYTETSLHLDSTPEPDKSSFTDRAIIPAPMDKLAQIASGTTGPAHATNPVVFGNNPATVPAEIPGVPTGGAPQMYST